ncbi:MAG: DedA family protein [Campylobacterales bacterium]
MGDLASFVVSVIGWIGYLGIFAFMFLESTFFPFPSEVVMIPAGYLVHQNKLNLFWVLAAGIGGNVLGALFNYYIALKWGRPPIARWIGEERLRKVELFFEKYGGISTFIGRLIPGVRQYISLPAGLGKMNIWAFIWWTTAGATIWAIFLTSLGYFIGANQQLIGYYLHRFNWIILAVGGAIFIYILYRSYRDRKER